MQEKKTSKTSSDVKTTKTPEVKPVVKEAAKKVETPVAAPKKTETVKKAEPVAAKKAEPVVAKKVEPVVEKKAETKEAEKKAVKKAPKKKEETKTGIFLQIGGAEYNLSDLENKVKDQFVADGHRAGCIKDLNIYVKPEENKAYYVINDNKFSGDINLL